MRPGWPSKVPRFGSPWPLACLIVCVHDVPLQAVPPHEPPCHYATIKVTGSGGNGGWGDARGRNERHALLLCVYRGKQRGELLLLLDEGSMCTEEGRSRYRYAVLGPSIALLPPSVNPGQ